MLRLYRRAINKSATASERWAKKVLKGDTIRRLGDSVSLILSRASISFGLFFMEDASG